MQRIKDSTQKFQENSIRKKLSNESIKISSSSRSTLEWMMNLRTFHACAQQKNDK